MRNALTLSFLLLAACSGSSSGAPAPATGAGGTGAAGTSAAGGESAGGTGGTTSAGGTTSTGGASAGGAGGGAAGAGGGGTTLNGCADGDFVDGTADTFDRTIAFGGTVGIVYSPKCLRVKAGQMVTFKGPFMFHPLAPGSTPTMPSTGSPGNPITATASGTSQAFTFPAAGSFPFLCTVHFANGMVGVVRVELRLVRTRSTLGARSCRSRACRPIPATPAPSSRCSSSMDRASACR